MDFLTQVAPGIVAILIAVAAWVTQQSKEKQRDKSDAEKEHRIEQAALSVQDLVALYESSLKELRTREKDLTEKVEIAGRRARENSNLIHDLNEKITVCEEKSAELEDKVRVLQATKATLNTQMAALILELEHLTGAIKARGVTLALPTP